MEENTALRQARTLRGWRQIDLANLLAVHRSTVIRWEHGTVPEVFWQEKLCALFEMSATQLGFSPSLDDITTPDPVGESTLLWYLPHLRNSFFTGREEILQQLHDTLAHERSALISQSYALSGLGGIGKTQTTIEYAYRYAKDYTAVFWINAETNEGIVSSIIAIADLLTLPEKQDTELVVNAVIRWLTTHSDWLLILDNVEDPAAVKRFLPPTRSGSFIFTSRRKALGIPTHTLDLPQMTREEGIRFLLHRARFLELLTSVDQLDQKEITFAEKIVAAMDGLPLALDQAGAYIEATQCRLSEYLSLFQSAPLYLLDEREAHMDHPQSVVRTFALAFEQLERSNSPATDLLTVCAFLAPEAIPETFFIEGAPDLGPTFETLAADSFALHATIKVLLTYSLVQRNPLTQTIMIHRMVQAVLKGRLSEESQQRWVTRVLRAMARLFPAEKIQTDYWLNGEKLLPHALVCVALVEQWSINESWCVTLMSHIATYLTTSGRFVEAERLLQNALRIGENTLDPQHFSLAEASYRLATLYTEQGKFEQAEPLYQRALHIGEQQLNPDHPRMARFYNSVAGLYRQKGRYKEAEPLYQHALRIWEQTMGPEHLYVTYALNNLANLYRDLGKYTQSVPLYQRALYLWEQTMGPEDAEAGYPLQGLARSYFELGKYEQAESLFQRALDLRERALGSEHHLITEPLIGLADIYSKQGKYEQAESLFQRALDLRERALGFEQPLLVEPLIGLADIYSKQGKYEQAESLFQRALDLCQQHLDPLNPQIAEVLYQVGLLYLMQLQTINALPFYQQALIIRERVFGMDHPKTLEIRTEYILLLKAVENEEEVK